MPEVEIIHDPDTGPRLADHSDEQNRQTFIRLYDALGCDLCYSWPATSAFYMRGVFLRRTAARLRAFPATYHLRSYERWVFGLFAFIVEVD
jgi:hypothetical protein